MELTDEHLKTIEALWGRVEAYKRFDMRETAGADLIEEAFTAGFVAGLEQAINSGVARLPA